MNSIVWPFLSRARVLVLPLLPDFDIRLVDAVGGDCEHEVWAHPFIDFWCVSLDPSPDGRMVYRKAAFTHHLLQVSSEIVDTCSTIGHREGSWWAREWRHLKGEGLCVIGQSLIAESLEQDEYISKPTAAAQSPNEPVGCLLRLHPGV